MTATRLRVGSGLRPFDLTRDLDGVADLIEVAFRDEAQRPWMRVQDELRGMRRAAPILGLLGRLSLDLQDTFGGFVWVEDGRIVGNATVGRLNNDRRRWILGNVGVLPEFRRRGIARRLTQAAISHARLRGAEWLVLDVRADNHNAYTLYRDLGFYFLEATQEMRLTQPKLVVQTATPDLRLRPVGPRDAGRLHAILSATCEPSVREVFPARRGQLLRQALRNLPAAALPFVRPDTCFLLGAERRGVIAGYGQQTPRGRARTLRLWVAPPDRGPVERPLAAALLRTAQRARPQFVLAEVSEGHAAAAEAFERLGFEVDQTMHRLALRLRG